MADERTPATANRWIWILGALVVVLAIALVVVLVTRDGGSSKKAQKPAAPTTTTRPVTTSTTHTTVAPTAPPTTSPPPPAPPVTAAPVSCPAVTPDPQVYAQYLFCTWQNGNQTLAANVASATAVQQMFAQPYSAGAGWTFSDCSGGAGSVYCTWNAGNGSKIQMQVRNLTGGLPIQVLAVQRI